MRRLRLLIILLCAHVMTASAETVDYFACNFAGGLPAGALSIDRDRQTLHFTMVQAGFDQGDAWKAFQKNGRSYAASPARHKKVSGEDVKAADDWLIMPAVSVMDADATLTWESATLTETLQEPATYRVMVSATGATPEDFTDAPLATVTEASLNTWTRHSASLSQYAGKRVWIAFVNVSLNCELTAVSDIRASGAPGLYLLQSTTPTDVTGTTPLTFTATLRATSAKPITAFTAYCEAGGKTFTKEYAGLNLTGGGAAHEITFPEVLPQAPGDTVDYSLRIEVPGNALEQPAVTGAVRTLLFPTRRRTVAEEGTGMWCTYCPRGIVAMEQMAEKYPEEFIGIAVHYDDVLGQDANVAAYCNRLLFPGFPSAQVNRHETCADPMPRDGEGRYTLLGQGLEGCFLREQQQPAPADLALLWTVNENGKITLCTTSHFAVNRADAQYRLTAVAVEDEVTDASYYQDNFYSGSQEAMGGFEQQPGRIRPYTFQQVARATLLPFEGVAAGIPSRITAGQYYSYEATLPCPSTIGNIKNVRLVVMLLDATDGRVVNAAQAKSVTPAEYAEIVSGIDTLSSAVPSTPAYDLTGRRVNNSARGVIIKNRKKQIY